MAVSAGEAKPCRDHSSRVQNDSGHRCPHCEDNLVSKLDTIRILVEEGQSDPMAVDEYNATAFHCYNGAVEGFEYLLHQDHFFVDLNHRNGNGLTVAMSQLISFSGFSAITAARAAEEDILAERQTKSRSLLPYPGASWSNKDVYLCAVWKLFSVDGTTLQYLRLLVRSIIAHEADPHKLTPNDMCYTILLVHKTISPHSNHFSVLEPVYFVLQASFRLWLQILRDAGVDIAAYLKEAKRLAAHGERARWHPFDDPTTMTTMWFRTEICGDSLGGLLHYR